LKDVGELQDATRFENNYSAVFSKFSPAFQEFVLTLLQPSPARRIPGIVTDRDYPVVKLFRTFPLLFGSGPAEEIIANVTPSPTQAALLQVVRPLRMNILSF
jgi:hypothetical protein